MVSKDKLSFVAFWYDGLTDENKLKHATHTLAEIGYKAVEWKNTCFEGTDNMANSLKLAIKAAEEVGMVTPAAVILRDITDPETCDSQIADVCDFIDACAEAGIKHVNMPTGAKGVKKYAYDGMPDTGDAWSCAAKSLERIAKRAEEKGVYIVLESVVGCLAHDYFTTRELFRLVDSPNLCLTLDPSHYHLYGNDIDWCVRQWGTDKIRHVHVKDAIGRIGIGGEPNMFPLLGEGRINWSGFFGALDDIGYDGALSVEFESWRYMREVLHNDVDLAAKLSYQSAAALIDNYLASKKS